MLKLSKLFLPRKELSILFTVVYVFFSHGTAFGEHGDHISIKNGSGNFDVQAMCSKSVRQNPQARGMVAPYRYSMSANLEDRRNGISSVLNLSDYILSTRIPGVSSIQLLESTAQLKNFVIPEREKQSYIETLNTMTQASLGYPITVVSGFGIPPCLALNDSQCVQVLNRSLAIMNPVDYNAHITDEAVDLLGLNRQGEKDPTRVNLGYWSMIEEWKSFGLDPVMIIGSARLARTVLNRVEMAKSGNVTEGDIFSDATTSFASLGLSKNDAFTYALTFLGLYGTRGAAVSPSLLWGEKHNYSLFLSMSIVASSMSFLDKINTASSHQYSLPNNITFSCEETRPYHFWMSAYLANRIFREGSTILKTSILNGLHVENVLYKAKAKVGTQMDGRNLNFDPLGSYYIETYKDQVLNDAGAFWALTAPTESRQLDLNPALSELFQRAGHSGDLFGGLRFSTDKYLAFWRSQILN